MTEPAPTMESIFAEQERNQHALAISMIRNQIRTAITELEEGDVDEALDTLYALVGGRE